MKLAYRVSQISNIDPINLFSITNKIKKAAYKISPDDYDLYKIMVVIAWKESNFDPEQIGRHGEVGLFQIKPGTAKIILTKIGQEPINLICRLASPENSGYIAAELLRDYWIRTKSWDETIRMYNQGEAFRKKDGKEKIRITRANEYLQDFKKRMQLLNKTERKFDIGTNNSDNREHRIRKKYPGQIAI